VTSWSPAALTRLRSLYRYHSARTDGHIHRNFLAERFGLAPLDELNERGVLVGPLQNWHYSLDWEKLELLLAAVTIARSSLE